MNILDQLCRDEGEVLHAYQDSRGFWTIGTGILIDKNGGGITHEENMFLVGNRLNAAHSHLSQSLPWFDKLDEARQGVLLNMAYNMGWSGLLAFHNTLSLIEQGKYPEAADAMLASRWTSQVGARAQRLAMQMRTGTWT